MEKIYLKYDDIRPYVECDYGFAKEIIYLGCIYPYKKGDLKNFFAMLGLQVGICILLIFLFNFSIILKLSLSFIMMLLVNLLFATNYNMLVIERLIKEGYYPVDSKTSNILLEKGICFKLQ